ncbi:hypothetical protein MMB75_05160 [Paenibacillus sp. P2(2022)]|uniref:hypothetical protein n=1 Tax=Paenibacillus TaxID=44249 RepID=UPI000362299C|nr:MULTISPECIES: hypothetical protein [Paenibacillus]MDG0053061.1 hypothetical protein [Paenibacillus sp. P2(2022)]NMP10555.1 hypothetical protein [Paenibacillus polymyxa]
MNAKSPVNQKKILKPKKKQVARKFKRVALRHKDANATIFLANNFYRDDFIRFIPANTRYTFTFIANNVKTISAGWDNDRHLPGVVLSYPQGNNWVVVIQTPTNQSFTATFSFVYTS